MKEKNNNGFKIPDRSKSGSEWDKFPTAEFSEKYKQHGTSYKINTLKYLCSFYREIVKEMGTLKGGALFIKTILWDLTMNKPEFKPEKFNIEGKEQEMFYRNKFNEYAPLVVFFQTLSRATGKKKADRLIADAMLPLVLEMMNSKYRPVEDINNIEIFVQQTRNYLGSEWEQNKGFSGDVYISKDKTELWFHITRCAPMQLLREYGMYFTAVAICMCDHITYHTLFPNLIFRRCHNLASGDEFCDLEFRIRNESDPVMDEDNYSDCARAPETREFVRQWEEKAKEMFFGSREAWDRYAEKCYSKNGISDS